MSGNLERCQMIAYWMAVPEGIGPALALADGIYQQGLTEGIRRCRIAVQKVNANSDFIRLDAFENALAAIDAVKGE